MKRRIKEEATKRKIKTKGGVLSGLVIFSTEIESKS
jgi:hypothetical protein